LGCDLAQAFDEERTETMDRDRGYKWLGWVVAAVLAVQIYFLRELLAAEVLFAVVFAGLALAFAVFYGLSAFGIQAFGIAESFVGATVPLLWRRFRQMGEIGSRSFRALRSVSAR
jgi:hypothetical protein